MGRAASIAVVLSLAVVGCKGSSDSGKHQVAEKPVAAAPRIPAGPVPVTLPRLPAKQARQVAAATAFVTVGKDGTLALGPLAPGPAPYAGKPRDPARESLEDQLFGPAQAVAAVDDPPPPDVDPDPTAQQDDPPPPEPDDPPPHKQGQYKMKKHNDDDAQLARQQAIEAARNAGVLGSTALTQGGQFASLTGTGDISGGFDDTAIYGGLLGNEIGELGSGLLAHGTYEEIGTLDALILADDGATAISAVDVIIELGKRRTSIAVEGTGAPDAVKFRFGDAPAPDQAPKVAVAIGFVPAALSVTPTDGKETTLAYLGTGVDRDALLTTLRANAAMRIVGTASITIDQNTTVQQLVDVLGAVGAAGATEVLISGPVSMNGGFGFGRSGFGPGGGGTGWGTIGTGRYGTLGHGSGTGTGTPTVSIGQPNAVGDLDKAIIRRYIKRNIQKIQYCYEKQLLAKPGLAGTVSTQFFISPTGEVKTANASGLDPDVADCVAHVIAQIEFPKPKGGGGVQVNYPFTFRPAGP